jgi:hypothetical protein
MWAYAVVDHSVYSMPYIVALLVCIAVFSGLFLMVKPLRSFRKKRCLVVYAVMVLVAGLLVFWRMTRGWVQLMSDTILRLAQKRFNPRQLTNLT